MKYLNILLLSAVVFYTSSCSYTVYSFNRGDRSRWCYALKKGNKVSFYQKGMKNRLSFDPQIDDNDNMDSILRKSENEGFDEFYQTISIELKDSIIRYNLDDDEYTLTLNSKVSTKSIQFPLDKILFTTYAASCKSDFAIGDLFDAKFEKDSIICFENQQGVNIHLFSFTKNESKGDSSSSCPITIGFSANDGMPLYMRYNNNMYRKIYSEYVSSNDYVNVISRRKKIVRLLFW